LVTTLPDKEQNTVLQVLMQSLERPIMLDMHTRHGDRASLETMNECVRFNVPLDT